MLTRFAPSPTGYLHIGNIRTALICYLYAKKQGGQFMLRIDDTDIERSKEEYVNDILQDLDWLGITPDRIERQSARFDRYDSAVEKLKADGRLYACYETAEELEIKRKMQLSRGLPPIYDRSALQLTSEQKNNFEAEGRNPHWRFKLEAKDSVWEDEVRGHQKFSAAHSSDPILIRGNGLYTYMLPSTVDDIEFGASHILRGEDHVSNTAIQIQIFEALGGKIPNFAHTSLIKSSEGKISKRDGKSSASVSVLRENGVDPLVVTSFLARLGTSDVVELAASLDELIAGFDIGKFSRSPTTYCLEDIYRLNTRLLHTLSFSQVQEELIALGIPNVDEPFWEAIRPNLEKIDEAKDWWRICNEAITPDIEDADFAKVAANLLPEGDWSEETWGNWTKRIKEETGRKGKQLFMPLRKALTGMEHGPELKVILPLIGRSRTIERLNGKKV